MYICNLRPALDGDLKWVVCVQNRHSDVSQLAVCCQEGHFCRIWWTLMLNRSHCREWWREPKLGRLSHWSMCADLVYFRFLKRKHKSFLEKSDICCQVRVWTCILHKASGSVEAFVPLPHKRKRSLEWWMCKRQQRVFMLCCVCLSQFTGSNSNLAWMKCLVLSNVDKVNKKGLHHITSSYVEISCCSNCSSLDWIAEDIQH